MRSRFSKLSAGRPNPSLVISVIALVVAVGGGAFAIGASNTKVVKKVVRSLAPGLSVNHANSADNATNANHATNSDQLGGVVASAFAKSSDNVPEGWHEIGSAGNPAFFTSALCSVSLNCWGNAAGYNTAAFYRDPYGVVHLKGVVQNIGSNPLNDFTMFTLPAGYHPAAKANFAVANTDAFGQLTVDAAGVVYPHTQAVAATTGTITLDGITFRCSPSGANGCP